MAIATRIATAGAAVALVLFHGFLLWQRIASLTLLEPAVALRWVATLVLLTGFARLRRGGFSLLWGRRALILWLLAALLHAGMAPAGALPKLEPGAGLLVALPLSLLVLKAVFVVGAGSGVGYGPRRLPRRWPTRPRIACTVLAAAPLSPRPPPA